MLIFLRIRFEVSLNHSQAKFKFALGTLHNSDILPDRVWLKILIVIIVSLMKWCSPAELPLITVIGFFIIIKGVRILIFTFNRSHLILASVRNGHSLQLLRVVVIMLFFNSRILGVGSLLAKPKIYLIIVP